jgi:hypothetical protein
MKDVSSNAYEIAKTAQVAAMWIYHTKEDRVIRVAQMRQFPFTTAPVDKELYFRGYGAGLKSAATFTAVTTTVTKNAAKYNLNNFPTDGDFLLDTANNINAAKAGVSGQASGLVFFKYTQATWGGSCCHATDGCNTQGTSNWKQCNQASGKLKLFAINTDNIIGHSFVDTKSPRKDNEALTTITYNAVMDMPAYYTTVRGRGGFGASTQKLVDIFWSMSSNNAASMSMQVLMHFYVIVPTSGTHASKAKNDADMKVSYGYPLNVWQKVADKKTSNPGRYAVSVGMKLYIAQTNVPVATHYGFYAVRMTPFFKASGGNEIQVVVNTDRAVKCWSWGSYNGAGYAEKHTHKALGYFGTQKYVKLHQFAGINMITCEIGTTAAPTGGDIIIIPATQTAADNPATVNNPLPGYLTSSSTVLSSCKTTMLTAANSKGPAIIAGSD